MGDGERSRMERTARYVVYLRGSRSQMFAYQTDDSRGRRILADSSVNC